MKKVKIHFSFKGICKVSAIKNVRAMSGMGLKEAKDYIDPFWVMGRWSDQQVAIISMEQFGDLTLRRLLDSSENMRAEMNIDAVEKLVEPVIADWSMNGTHA